MPGLIFVEARAMHCRLVSTSVLSELEVLSTLLNHSSSYCKGNESSIRLFIQLIQTQAGVDTETSLVMAD